MYKNTNLDDEYSTKVDRIIGENTDLTRDLENWMTKLPTSLRSLPIIYLAIPGLCQIVLDCLFHLMFHQHKVHTLHNFRIPR